MESPVLGIILGFAFLFAISSIAIMQFHQNEQFRLSLDAQVIISQNQKGMIEIIGIDCDEPDLNITYVHVKNVGNDKMTIDDLDVYFPDRFPRNESNRTISLVVDILDPRLWNPEEEMNITLYKQLQPGVNYTFSISNAHGITASMSCIP